MTVLKINDQEFELKFTILLDKELNKHIKEDDEEGKKGRARLSGGIQKVLPDLIDQEVGTLAQVFEIAIKTSAAGRKLKASIDDILEAIEARMEEDGDTTKIFEEVFETLDAAVFSRKQLTKFAENMQLLRTMKSNEDDKEKEQVEMMLKRLNDSYKEITGKVLFEDEQTTKTA